MPAIQKLMETADKKLGGMDASLGAATERQGVLMTKLQDNPELLAIAREAQTHISAAHRALGDASKALGAAATAATKHSGQQPGSDEEPTTPGGQNPPAPHFPPDATIVEAKPGMGGALDLGTVSVNGGQTGAVIPRGQWAYFTAKGDGDVATASCDGVKIAMTVTDGAPTHPGEAYNGNTAEVRPYKAGQYVNVFLGEGGYSQERALLFGVAKYA